MSERITCPLCGNKDAEVIRADPIEIIGCECMEGRGAVAMPKDWEAALKKATELLKGGN